MPPSPHKNVRKPRTLLVTIVLGIGVVAYSFGMFLPGQKSVASLRLELRQQHVAVMQADRLLYPIQQAEREVAEAQEFLREVRSRMASRNEMAALFGKIHQEAIASQTTMLRFEPQPFEQLETIGQTPIHMILEGSYSSVTAFLHRLESLPCTPQISHLQIHEAGESSGNLRLELTLTIFTDFDENSG